MVLLFLSFLAGLVSALGFEPLGLWPLTLLAFAFLLRMVNGATSLRSALARGWWFGVGQFILGLNWIATAFTFQAAMPEWLGWVAVLLLSLFLALYPAAAAGLAWRWGKDRPLSFTFFFAAGWIVTEWLRATLFTGFAWNPAGIVLLDRSIAPLAAWIGTYGLSAMLILFAGLIWIAVAGPDRRQAFLLAGIALAGQLAAFLALPRPPEGSGPAVRVVQPNIGQELKWTPGFADRNMARLAALSTAPSTNPERPRLLIWPEAAVTEPLQDGRQQAVYQSQVAATRHEVAEVIGRNDLLLTGGIAVRSTDGIGASSATNSVFAIAPGGRILSRYDKGHLVPYGEYLPMRPLLSALGLSRLAPGDMDFDSGPGPETLSIPGAGRIGFQICYEIIFSGQVVEPGDRPTFIFNPSNDAWFGAWGPPQHLAQARLRALEEGLPIVRATPTGISAIIDARGEVLESLPLGEAGIIDARLPLPAPPTLFSRFGNGLPLGFAFILAVAGLRVRGRSRPVLRGRADASAIAAGGEDR